MCALPICITFPNIATDLVASAAIQSSNGLNFTNNVMRINVSCRAGSYPTLDSVIIVDSNNSYIGHNDIVEIDKVNYVIGRASCRESV